MNREEVLETLRAHRADLERFGVRSLSIFGSVARGEAGPESDVDVLADFGGPPSFDRYMDLKLYLEDLLGTRVDLATPGGLRARLRPIVDREAIRVA
ncbi:MAG TPA: nucleotidyltransferase family protein [Longimicrobiaceae bacterium]|nr:nucleotidyltransferase family protein [Longimicrobiaceae bacterium]